MTGQVKGNRAECVNAWWVCVFGGGVNLNSCSFQKENGELRNANG